MFKVVLVASTVVSIINETDSPAFKLPIDQIPLLESKIPTTLPTTLGLTKPSSRTSVTTTLTASSGPLLVTVIVQETTVPLRVTRGSTVLTIPKSASAGTTVLLEALLLSGLGSSVSEVTLTTLVIVVLVALILVSKINFKGTPTSRSPMLLQTLFAYEPRSALTRTKINPLGNTSLTMTFSAIEGPLFTIVIVQLTRVSLRGVRFETVLLIAKSAEGVALTVSLTVELSSIVKLFVKLPSLVTLTLITMTALELSGIFLIYQVIF